MGYEGVQAAHVGRYLELETNEKTDAVSGQIQEACERFLSNPVIEDYRIEWETSAEA